MNILHKHPVSDLGYNFIEAKYIPQGKDEYYLRNAQNHSGIEYRKLNSLEIEVLVRNRNTSDDWNNIFVSKSFNPELVKNCQFYGLIRIGKKVSLPKALIISYEGSTITIFNELGGALTLPRWDGSEGNGQAPSYLRKQILKAREKLALLKLKANSATNSTSHSQS